MIPQASILLSMPAQLPSKVIPQQDDVLFGCYGRVIDLIRAHHGFSDKKFVDYEVNENNVRLFGSEDGFKKGAVDQAATAFKKIHETYDQGNLEFATWRSVVQDAVATAIAPQIKDQSQKRRMREKQLDVAIDLTELNSRQLDSWARVREFLTKTHNLVVKDALAEKPEDQPIGSREKRGRVVIAQTADTSQNYLLIHFEASTKLALWAGKEIGKGYELTDNRIRQTYNNLVIDEARRRSLPDSELPALRIDR